MEWSWLLLLMCPLMMLPMFFMMKGNHSGHQNQNRTPEKLTEELNEVKKQNEQMLQEIQQLKQQRG